MIQPKKGAMFGLDCRTLRKQFGELFLVSRHSEASKGASGSCGYTKRAAMFGLDCRTLRKQFGELFLVSRHSEASKGASGSCGYTKRGAMFGLDARIALAIFGALSVISGAALYSTIQDSKVTNAITQLSELNKAYEAYFIDTGIDIEPDSVNGLFLHVEELLSSTQSGWKGPYIGLSNPNTYTLDYINDYVLGFFTLRNSDWVDTSSASFLNARCVGGSYLGDCYIWGFIALGTTQSDLDFANAIDLKVDGVNDGTTGNVRVFRGDPSNVYYVLLKGKRHSSIATKTS